MSARYAIYFAPAPDSGLEDFGVTWLGRHHRTGADLDQPRVPGLTSEELLEITAAPRHYGFHGTLKAPFRLAEGRTVADLEAAAKRFAAARSPFRVPPLVVTDLDGFIALTPSGPAPTLDALAADCVRGFDVFRAPASADELARRRRGGLSPRQDSNLLEFGYPFVMDDFRFHLTLTRRLDDSLKRRLLAFLHVHTKVIGCREIAIDAITIFMQESSDRPFQFRSRHAFGKD